MFKKPSPLQMMLALIMGSLLVIFMTGSLFFYYLFFVFLLLTLGMYGLLQMNAAKIIQNIQIKEHEITKGDPIEAKLMSRNDAILAIAHGHLACTVYNDRQKYFLPNFQQSFLPSVMLAKTTVFDMHTRGMFTHVSIKTNIQDPLRLFSKSFEHIRPIDLLVYPRVYDLKYFHVPLMGHQGTKKSLRYGQEDYSNIKKVRPYNAGDSMKRIHWKLSSKRDDFFVKEYESTSSAKAYVILDAHKENYVHDHALRVEDCAVEVVASISKYTLRKNTETTLIYENKGIVKHQGKDLSHYDNILKALVSFGSYGQLSFPELIHEESKKMEQNAFLVLVTPFYSDDLMETLLGLKGRRFQISLIVVQDKPMDKDKCAYIEAMGINLYEVAPSNSITDVLETYK